MAVRHVDQSGAAFADSTAAIEAPLPAILGVVAEALAHALTFHTGLLTQTRSARRATAVVAAGSALALQVATNAVDARLPRLAARPNFVLLVAVVAREQGYTA